MAFADFPTIQSQRSYIYSNEFLAYLQSYAEHFDLIGLIRFRRQVINIRPQNIRCNNTKWEVFIKTEYTKLFSYCISNFLLKDKSL